MTSSGGLLKNAAKKVRKLAAVKVEVMFETRKLEDRRTAMRRDQHRRIID
jgi:hypothetical protein